MRRNDRFRWWIAGLLFDERYRDATWMAPILLVGYWPRFLTTLNQPILMAIAKPQYGTLSGLLGR